MKKLILGSGSPRRAQLLSEMGYEFEVRISDIEENISSEVSNLEAAEFLAQLKSQAFNLSTNEILITADTVVISGSEILGKPADKNEAIKMLSNLAGQTHLVISGVCIRDNSQTHSLSNTTEVKFKEFTKEEIDYYVDNFTPFDKAGAYGIQEWIGLTGVEKINGSYYNVVGLPCHDVYNLLVSQFDLKVSK